jgi:hypothetical protein
VGPELEESELEGSDLPWLVRSVLPLPELLEVLVGLRVRDEGRLLTEFPL